MFIGHNYLAFWENWLLTRQYYPMSSAGQLHSPVEPPTKKRKLAGVDSTVEIHDMAQNGASNGKEGEIDEGLYSRQLYVLGHDAMRRMAKSDVLISGLRGLGVEVAKNVILGGVKSVTLHDESDIVISDLSSQFYFTEACIGKNRAEASRDALAELNSYVPVKSYTGSLTEDLIKQFRVVVLTSNSLEEQLRVSEITHANDIALIVADTKGLYAQVFCDFGPEFTVVDTTGENPISAMIANISRDTDGVVTCLDDNRHGFEDGDYVTFSEIQGMTELNDCSHIKIKVLGPYTFSIGDTSQYSEYIRGGVVTQVKMPKTLKFKPLKESLESPEFLITDFAKWDNPSQLHVAFQALHKFQANSGRLPKPWNIADADELVSIAKTIKTDVELNATTLEWFSYVAAGDLCPMNAAIGGIVAQEVMKACSGKFHPIYQWLYFDAVECHPARVAPLSEAETAPSGSRYDAQVTTLKSNTIVRPLWRVSLGVS